MKLGRQLKYHEGHATIRHYANQPTRSELDDNFFCLFLLSSGVGAKLVRRDRILAEKVVYCEVLRLFTATQRGAGARSGGSVQIVCR